MSHRKQFLALTILILAAAGAQAQFDCSSQLLGSTQPAAQGGDWLSGSRGTGGTYFAVDIATGNGTFIGTMAANLATELEYDVSTGELWADEVDGQPNLHMLDPATGGTITMVTHTPGALTGLEFVGSTLYGTFIDGSGVPSTLVIVDTGTGALTPVGATGFGPISALTYDTIGGVMYGVVGGGSPADLVTLNLGTGVASTVGSTGLSSVGGLAFGPDGTLYAGTTDNDPTPSSLFTVDPATGATTLVGSIGFSVTGLTACSDIVPVELRSVSVD